MKICRYTADGLVHLGLIEGDNVLDLTAIGYGTSMRAFLTAGQQHTIDIDAARTHAIPLNSVELLAPINDPEKFIALGMNYKEHADGARAAGIPVPKSQLWFNKQVSCINDPYAGFEMPIVSDQLDYEAELAIVIGKTCRHVKPEDVRSVIAGYMVGNDVSVRDWQLRSPTFTLGKSFDTHGPIGPWITTDDEIEDPQNLAIKTWVNGELRQDSNTDDMIYSIAEQISYISQAFTLKPGDILLTGTPAGVGIETGSYLSVGDVVKVEIENLGHIENTVIPEPVH